jgi:hypothetical protein
VSALVVEADNGDDWGVLRRRRNPLHSHYDFGRAHKTLANPYPSTSAVVVGVEDHPWTAAENR